MALKGLPNDINGNQITIGSIVFGWFEGDYIEFSDDLIPARWEFSGRVTGIIADGSDYLIVSNGEEFIPKEVKLASEKYAKFTERNEWEGESWHFYIPIEGNEVALDQLKQIIAENELKSFDVDDEIIDIETINILVENDTEIGYMPKHNVLSGKLDLSRLNKETSVDGDLYKGRIRKLMIEQQRG